MLTRARARASLKTVLENHGATVQMFEYPRGYRLPPWLPERGKRASGHDIFISCHHNGHNGGSQGTETLVDVDATERDISLAHSVQSGVVNALRLEDRGVKWQVRAGFQPLYTRARGSESPRVRRVRAYMRPSRRLTHTHTHKTRERAHSRALRIWASSAALRATWARRC